MAVQLGEGAHAILVRICFVLHRGVKLEADFVVQRLDNLTVFFNLLHMLLSGTLEIFLFGVILFFRWLGRGEEHFDHFPLSVSHFGIFSAHESQ